MTTEGEVLHGHAIAGAAREMRVPHLVYSPVGAAERDNGGRHIRPRLRLIRKKGHRT
jgi:hypothetical protein